MNFRSKSRFFLPWLLTIGWVSSYATSATHTQVATQSHYRPPAEAKIAQPMIVLLQQALTPTDRSSVPGDIKTFINERNSLTAEFKKEVSERMKNAVVGEVKRYFKQSDEISIILSETLLADTEFGGQYDKQAEDGFARLFATLGDPKQSKESHLYITALKKDASLRLEKEKNASSPNNELLSFYEFTVRFADELLQETPTDSDSKEDTIQSRIAFNELFKDNIDQAEKLKTMSRQELMNSPYRFSIGSHIQKLIDSGKMKEAANTIFPWTDNGILSFVSHTGDIQSIDVGEGPNVVVNRISDTAKQLGGFSQLMMIKPRTKEFLEGLHRTNPTAALRLAKRFNIDPPKTTARLPSTQSTWKNPNGDVTKGKLAFETRCMSCHRNKVRQSPVNFCKAAGHAAGVMQMPPAQSTQISDGTRSDIVAYLLSNLSETDQNTCKAAIATRL